MKPSVFSHHSNVIAKRSAFFLPLKTQTTFRRRGSKLSNFALRCGGPFLACTSQAEALAAIIHGAGARLPANWVMLPWNSMYVDTALFKMSPSDGSRIPQRFHVKRLIKKQEVVSWFWTKKGAWSTRNGISVLNFAGLVERNSDVIEVLESWKSIIRSWNKLWNAVVVRLQLRGNTHTCQGPV